MSPRLAILSALLAALALAGAGAAYVAQSGRRETASTVSEAFLGADRFKLPGGYFRPSSRGGGRLERLDLAAYFPDFTPAGETTDVTRDTDLAERFEKLVFLAVTPAAAGLDPSERVARLYARFLEPDGWSHPGGLIARAFQEGSPFEGQELYFVAPEGRDFAARCGRPDQTRKTPNSCVYDFREGGFDIEMRFSPALSEWEKLTAGARGLIEAARR